MLKKAFLYAPRETAAGLLGVLVGWFARARRDRRQEHDRLAFLRRVVPH